MTIAILGVLCALFIVLDAVPMTKGKHKGEILIYSIIFIASFSILIAKSLGVSFPSPSEPVKQFLESVFKVK